MCLAARDLSEDLTSQFHSATRHHNKKELRALQRKVAYSEITVSIQPSAPPPPAHRRHHDPGFITNSAHTALRVLTVIAGVGLIVFAVLVPLGLLVAAAWGLAQTMRRRRRERALDLA